MDESVKTFLPKRRPAIWMIGGAGPVQQGIACLYVTGSGGDK